MQLPPSSIDAKIVIVADTSVIINLNATGLADTILKILPNRLIIPDMVAAELAQGGRLGYQDSSFLDKLIVDGHLTISSLNERAEEHFKELIAGPACDTLDDGEASTIACALDLQAIAAIDEKKANRICASKYPSLPVIATTDLLAHPSIETTLGKEQLADCVFNALRNARMRVRIHHVEWIISLIGAERAALCTSLSVSVRSQQAELISKIRKSG